MTPAASAPTKLPRDAVARIHRTTRENRSLWYQLTVLQQPERARACGSGMKANSDRRPVDPPPVVELRIIEGPSVEEGKDITFDYNANFFLYASLEQARTLAHGRVQSSAASNPPILTGVPASGMAYLDRPVEAGYFIFPDLSVRHEGYFRLAFSLFETTKEEKDFDMDPIDPDFPPGVDWRMEIKTQPFNVFSAKKFPGLMESTQLSKTVADQGCRVRIRRDVRMRKRDSKAGAFERREDDYRRRTATPAPDDSQNNRDRSHSSSSEHHASYSAEASRRPSGVDAYRPAPPAPAPAPAPAPPRYESALPNRASGHVRYPDHSAPQSHFADSRRYALPPQTPAHHTNPSASYPSTFSSPYGKPEPSNYGYAHHSRSLSSTCPSPGPSIRPDLQNERSSGGWTQPAAPASTSSHDFRRNSSSQQPPLPSGLQDRPQYQQPQYQRSPYQQSSYQQSPYQQSPYQQSSYQQSPYQQPQQTQQLQHPAKTYAPSIPAVSTAASTAASTTAPAAATTAPSSLAPLKIAHLVLPNSLPPIEPQPRRESISVPMLLTGEKRKRDEVFPPSPRPTSRPLHSRQRQDSAYLGRTHGPSSDRDLGTYARADGQLRVIDFDEV
ncbi:hypothetical protein E4U23_002885 [Claviceps purpurea]|nr:hypothetical protein E4U23_002885 [Claviceps purpurea]KAG6271255.1 hypothetical protein E4U49_004387 [Claviceps purpurea]